MGIKEFIEKMNKESKFKWEHLETIAFSDIGFHYKIIAENDCGFYYHFRVSSEALESFPFEELKLHFDAEMIEHEMTWIYRMFAKMKPSMQKAVVDIIKTQNGEEIDDRANDI